MTINENELADARVAWGDGMIAISKAYEKSGIDDATIVANEMLDQLYGCLLYTSPSPRDNR